MYCCFMRNLEILQTGFFFVWGFYFIKAVRIRGDWEILENPSGFSFFLLLAANIYIPHVLQFVYQKVVGLNGH